MNVLCLAAAPPLSVDKVVSVLESFTHKWRYVGEGLLQIPDKALKVIESEQSSDAERLRAAVRYWLLRDPLASWRKLIHMLDFENNDACRAVTKNIRSYAEKQRGQKYGTLVFFRNFRKSSFRNMAP